MLSVCSVNKVYVGIMGNHGRLNLIVSPVLLNDSHVSLSFCPLTCQLFDCPDLEAEINLTIN